jgi:TPR repeat protein
MLVALFRVCLKRCVCIVTTGLLIGATTLATGQDLAHLSLQELQAQASSGNAAAQNELGDRYDSGEGVPRNWITSSEWYRKAAEQGDRSAEFNLGYAYELGRGTSIDTASAAVWYTKAAAQGHVIATVRLAHLYEMGNGVARDDARMFALYLDAAKAGNVTGEYMVGLAYDAGRGVPRDPVSSVKWWAKAAEQGEIHAMNLLACAYDLGRGTQVDISKAVYWFTQSAMKGNATSARDLGMIYESGKDVPKDLTAAAKWYKVSADGGDSIGEFNYAWALEKGLGVPQDLAQAAIYYQKAADQRHAMAQNNLAYMYAHGEGVPQDNVKALSLYRLAAAQGVESAKKEVSNLETLSAADAPRISASDLEAQALANLAQTNPRGVPQSNADPADSQVDYQQRLRDHEQQVTSLRSSMEAADRAAEQAETEAQKAKDQVQQSANSGAGGLLGALSIGLSGTAQYEAEKIAKDRRAEADRLRSQLRDLGQQVIEPPPLRDSIAEGATEANAGFARTTEQARDNLSAPSAPAHTTKSPFSFNPLPPASNKPQVQAAVIPVSPQQSQRAQPIIDGTPQSSGTVPGICPSSGIVPGVSLPNRVGVMSPVPCKPGTHYGPLIATTLNGGYTGVTPPDGLASSGAGICPASGYVMVQTGDVSVANWCTPGQPINGTSSSISGTSQGPSNGSGATGCTMVPKSLLPESIEQGGPPNHCVGYLRATITNGTNMKISCWIKLHANGNWIDGTPFSVNSGSSGSQYTCGADRTQVLSACFAVGAKDSKGVDCLYDVNWDQR